MRLTKRGSLELILAVGIVSLMGIYSFTLSKSTQYKISKLISHAESVEGFYGAEIGILHSEARARAGLEPLAEGDEGGNFPIDLPESYIAGREIATETATSGFEPGTPFFLGTTIQFDSTYQLFRLLSGNLFGANRTSPTRLCSQVNLRKSTYQTCLVESNQPPGEWYCAPHDYSSSGVSVPPAGPDATIPIDDLFGVDPTAGEDLTIHLRSGGGSCADIGISLAVIETNSGSGTGISCGAPFGGPCYTAYFRLNIGAKDSWTIPKDLFSGLPTGGRYSLAYDWTSIPRNCSNGVGGKFYGYFIGIYITQGGTEAPEVQNSCISVSR